MASSSQENAVNTTEVPDWKKAADGISLFINNHGVEAEKLFMENTESLTIRSAYAYVLFMDAIMSFEEDKLVLANEILKDVEKRCGNQSGWMKSMSRVFSYRQDEQKPSLTEYLENQIILADSQILIATLTFLQNDISGILKAVWALRKSYKVYHRIFSEIKAIYEVKVGTLVLPDPEGLCLINEPIPPELDLDNSSESPIPSSPTSPSTSPNGYIPNSPIPHSKSAILNRKCRKLSDNSLKNLNISLLKKSVSFQSSLSSESHTGSFWDSQFGILKQSMSNSYLKNVTKFFTNDIKADMDQFTIKRLMSAVCYGYGLLHLGISLLPPSVLKLIQILGFNTNRQTGISCLMFARNSEDMRAPLATLSLLWYHTIVRPFYCVDGSNIQAGAEAARVLLEESQDKYKTSTLFLFFEGRMYRTNADIPSALRAFKKAVDSATQRELKILALHEEGWCHLIALDFENSRVVFLYLKQYSRWSVPFYCYIALLCTGLTKGEEAVKTMSEIRMSGQFRQTHKANSLTDYLLKRLAYFQQDLLPDYKPIFYKLLLFELLYLWNSIPSCSEESINKIIEECAQVQPCNRTEEPMDGLSRLIEGSCYIVKHDYTKAVEVLKDCLAIRNKLASTAPDAHISAYAKYELAAILIKISERKEEGKKLLQEVNNYHSYDFDQKLGVKVNSLLKQL